MYYNNYNKMISYDILAQEISSKNFYCKSNSIHREGPSLDNYSVNFPTENCLI